MELVEPLVIRANEGDDIEIHFENQLPFNTGMHIQNAEYDVMTSDGAFVGRNPDTTAAPGETIVYKWKVLSEGVHYFSDLGTHYPVNWEATFMGYLALYLLSQEDLGGPILKQGKNQQRVLRIFTTRCCRRSVNLDGFSMTKWKSMI